LPNPARSRWAGVAPDDRRAERRALLLDAAFELLGTEGWSGTTVRAVCQTAQLNPRYFYESFDDLDALVVALYDRLVDELRVELEKAVASADPAIEAQVRVTVETTVRFVDSDRRRGRVLYHEALGNEALNRRRVESGFALAELIAGGSKERQVAAAFVVGGFSEVLMAWLDGRITVSRKRLIEQTTDLFLAIGR
jgi:AcrR family transcriptional regulator